MHSCLDKAVCARHGAGTQPEKHSVPDHAVCNRRLALLLLQKICLVLLTGIKDMPMIDHPELRYLTDAKGNVEAVQLSLKLWQLIESKIGAQLKATEAPTPLVQAEGPLKNFEQLQQFWDFKYPYSPAVDCPYCGASTADWRADPAQPFILTNANIGGLLVFLCKGCGTTVRQKHFRDHMAVEHSTPKG